MLNKSKTIHTSVIYGVTAGIVHAVGLVVGDSVWIGSAIFVGQAILSAAAVVTFVEYSVDWITNARERDRSSRAISREGSLAERLAGLDAEGRKLLRELLTGDLLDEDGAGSYYLGTFVPDSFVRDLISQSRGNSFVPERIYSDGSNGRRYYKAVVSFLIREGVAVVARGNRPAEITTNWRDVIRVLGKAEKRESQYDNSGAYAFRTIARNNEND